MIASEEYRDPIGLPDGEHDEVTPLKDWQRVRNALPMTILVYSTTSLLGWLLTAMCADRWIHLLPENADLDIDWVAPGGALLIEALERVMRNKDKIQSTLWIGATLHLLTAPTLSVAWLHSLRYGNNFIRSVLFAVRRTPTAFALSMITYTIAGLIFAGLLGLIGWLDVYINRHLDHALSHLCHVFMIISGTALILTTACFRDLCQRSLVDDERNPMRALYAGSHLLSASSIGTYSIWFCISGLVSVASWSLVLQLMLLKTHLGFIWFVSQTARLTQCVLRSRWLAYVASRTSAQHSD